MYPLSAAGALDTLRFHAEQSGAWRTAEQTLVLAGRYIIERQLGIGTFGTVYLGRRIASPDQQVAVKLLRRDRHDPNWTRCLEKEAAALEAASDRHLIEIEEYGYLFDGRPFLVLEYVAGETIADLLAREGAFRISDVSRIAIQTLRALEALHHAGVIHNDISPGNIFLTRTRISRHPIVKVFDLGISRTIGKKGDPDMPILCSPLYAAPEIVRNETATPAADIYSLAHVLAELLDGTPAFDGCSSEEEIVQFHLKDSDVPLGNIAAGSVFGDILRRALKKDPRRRFSTATEMRLAVEDAAGRLLAEFHNEPALMLNPREFRSAPDWEHDFLPLESLDTLAGHHTPAPDAGPAVASAPAGYEGSDADTAHLTALTSDDLVEEERGYDDDP